MRKYGLIKLGLAAVMLTSASAASEGADVSGGPAYLPPAPPLPFVYNWTGFYAGADVPARVRPGPAHFAVDQPIVEGVADPRSECGDPI